MRRVLVWGMTNNKAGTEAVINNLVALAPKQVVFDFLSFEHLANWPCILNNGGKVVLLPNKRTDYFAYWRSIIGFFRNHATDYDALWSNLNILNNIDAIKLAHKYDIPRIILHAHNSMKDGKPHQRLLCALNAPVVGNCLTERWACSKQAGIFFFGDEAFRVVPNAIDMAKYAYSHSARLCIREEMGLGSKFVIGTVGRLTYQKNQELLIRCMPDVLRHRPSSHLVIVGRGELEDTLRHQAEEIGVDGHVSFLGQRSDIPRVLSSFDVFAFPSHFEGFGVVLLEAQANGLPCVISNTISDDPIVSEGCSVVDIEDERAWVNKLLDSGRENCRPIPERAKQYDLPYQEEALRSLFIW